MRTGAARPVRIDSFALAIFRLIPLMLGLTALLALGWDRSPLRMHATTAAVWAVVAGALALVEVRRVPRESAWWFLAASALAVSAIALIASLVALMAFIPCGAQCV